MEFELSPTPPRAGYRSYDPQSQDRRLYAVMLNRTQENVNVVIRDGETAVVPSRLELLGTTHFSLLGNSRLMIT